MPKERKIRVAPGTHSDPHDDISYIGNPIYNGAIYLKFGPLGSPSGSPGGASISAQGDIIQFSHVTIEDFYIADGEERATVILLHELFHALGIDFHVGAPLTRRHSSIMDRHGGAYANGREQPLSIAYPIDHEALQWTYAGTSPLSYGAWSEKSWHTYGSTPNSEFGVAARNGYLEPWARGILPLHNISANPALVGNVYWNGSLIGFTPQGNSVIGDTTIHLNVDTLMGNAMFDKLESWAPYTSPGVKGTGSQFLDGSLHYTVKVSGNTFSETGGDNGRLTGVFVGHRHEGAAGTLQRDDLTAAFGASR